jgi:hypothetical protein
MVSVGLFIISCDLRGSQLYRTHLTPRGPGFYTCSRNLTTWLHFRSGLPFQYRVPVTAAPADVMVMPEIARLCRERTRTNAERHVGHD